MADLRRIARRRLPRGVFDYIDGAPRTSARWRPTAAFARTTFRPRVLRDVGKVDPATTLLGRPLPLPLVLAPTGFTRIADPEGELAVARSAARAGLPYTLSTLSTRSIEEVAAASDGPAGSRSTWRDRGLVREMVERAAAGGYEALVLTVDTGARPSRAGRAPGSRCRRRSGRARWWTGPCTPPGPVRAGRADPVRQRGGGDVGDGSDAVSLADYINSQFDPALSWRDVEWLRSGGTVRWCSRESRPWRTQLAAEAGVEAIALSNHGAAAGFRRRRRSTWPRWPRRWATGSR